MKHDNSKVHRLSRKRVDFIKNRNGESCILSILSISFNHLFGEDNGNYGNKYEFNSLSIPILQIDILGNIVREWSSATEASEKGNFHAGPIAACCKGKRHIYISVANIDRKPVNIKILYGAEEKEKYINLIDITTKI